MQTSDSRKRQAERADVEALAEHWHWDDDEVGAFRCGYVERREPCPIPERLYVFTPSELAADRARVRAETLAEAERERDRIEALIEASSLGTPEAKAARESVPSSTGSAIVVAAKHMARAERAEAALEKVWALADAWERDAAAACDGADHSGCPDCDGKVYAADLLRALLDGDA